MSDIFERTISLIGEDNVKKLQNSKVAIVGLGGVGGYTLEALARAGVGSFVLIDNDTISASNINRQILATNESVNKFKTLVAKERTLNINPNAKIKTYEVFVDNKTIHEIDFTNVNFIVDAIDTMSAKIELIKKAKELNISIISSMGTGNKLDGNSFKFSDIYKTKVCPVCKVMRKLCKDNDIESLKVLYSQETPLKPKQNIAPKTPPASISYVPAIAGLLIGGEVIKSIINYWGEGIDKS